MQHFWWSALLLTGAIMVVGGLAAMVALALWPHPPEEAPDPIRNFHDAMGAVGRAAKR